MNNKYNISFETKSECKKEPFHTHTQQFLYIIPLMLLFVMLVNFYDINC